MARLKNIINKGHTNVVVIVFSFDGDYAAAGLDNFNKVELSIGGETYNTTNDATKLFVIDQFKLGLKIGTSTSLDAGTYSPEITAYDNDKNIEGTLLNDPNHSRIDRIIVRE